MLVSLFDLIDTFWPIRHISEKKVPITNVYVRATDLQFFRETSITTPIIWQAVKSSSSSSFRWAFEKKGLPHSFSDVCAKSKSSEGQKCFANEFMELSSKMSKIRSGKEVNMTFPRFYDPAKDKFHFLPGSFGNITLVPQSRVVQVCV